MNRDVVEGNSTSLSPNPQEPALMDASHLHMNDLGLTPFPGFQLRGNTLQDQEQSCRDEHEHFGTGYRDDIQPTRGEGSISAEILGIPTPQTDLEGFDALVNNKADSDDLFDPLFDSTIPELDDVFSRKRSAEELQESPPEKRQRQQTNPLDETPSLTPDSTHESSASFFDTFDSMFCGPFELPLVLPDEPLFDLEIPQPPFSPPRISESTREGFSLDEQDILSNTTREFLKMRKEPEYVSPYPVSGGPLGYLPSSPTIHVKCVAVGDEKANDEIRKLRAQLYRTTRERDQYKKSLSEYTKLDGTGKSPEQLLREENSSLRRVSTRHQARVEEYKQEASEWRTKLHNVSVLYNNLLYEIGVEKRLPSITSIPAGYKPPRKTAVIQPPQAPVIMQDVAGKCWAFGPPTQQLEEPLVQSAGASNSQPFGRTIKQPMQEPRCVTIDLTPEPLSPQISVPEQATDAGNIHTSDPQPQQHELHARQQLTAITIDLTEEDEAPPTPPPVSEHATLRSLRSKKYDWLQAGNDMVENSQVCTFSMVEDDELARMMEEELSRT
ncbi:uncharacterized protein DSM5745_06269 [Aspergillus mulundensis]|uniref:Uncharacterized protein n=1 Tax=Aspergillus mulundensis TaxID=1810919 RepID=A0A3D8RQC1_9EURO|nr:hypothetical protein DSM5745_06269 [Aspergillus mulundensis]RDW76277.1 hypothetical protein DSM5745_06269 [Aspergillus mulundensis]